MKRKTKSKSMRVRGLLMFEAPVDPEDPSASCSEILREVLSRCGNGNVQFSVPGDSQISKFAASGKSWMKVEEEPPPPDAAEVLLKEKELAFHWLRLPEEVRLRTALDLKLVTERQITSLKPKDLNLAIIIQARKKGKKKALWRRIDRIRRQWGEI